MEGNEAAVGRVRFFLSAWNDGEEASHADSLDRIREFFTNGQCGVFAVILHEHTGWPICGLCEKFSCPSDSGVYHWFCRMPDGRFADARGIGRAFSDFEIEFGRPERCLAVRESDPAEVVTRFVRLQANYQVLRDGLLVALLPELADAVDEPGNPSASLP